MSLLAKLGVDPYGAEGAWSGNDTVWRMTLDLNRILLYARPDGTMSDTLQRRVVTISDAAIAGQGDGPLAPESHPLGALVAGRDSAPVDIVGAHLLGYSSALIPTIREADAAFRWPIRLGSASREVVGDRVKDFAPPTLYPAGWVNAVDPDRESPVIARIFERPLGARVAQLFTDG